MINKIKKSNLILVFADILVIFVSYIFSLYILNYENINEIAAFKNILLSILIYMIFLNYFKMYLNLIQYEIGKDYLKYIVCCILSALLLSLIGKSFNLEYLDYLRINVLCGNGLPKRDYPFCNLLIVGAGLGGREMIITIKNTTQKRYNIVGLIDDDKSKYKKKILGVEILGNRYDIPRIVEEHDVDYIFLAISKVSAIERRKILELCGETKAKIKVWPTAEDVIDKQGPVNSLRDVEIEDLLGREPIRLENKDIMNLIKNQVVLVTGGGGSIGSEICRQIINYNPKKLIILDIYENNLYDIEMELRGEYFDRDIKTVVASVRDIERLKNVFKEYEPSIVLHAAAHKHVPLMEDSPLEAIHNNIFGTYNVAKCADEYNVKKFVLISTDKAVNPTNIMGATKRFCELIIQSFDKISKTDYCAVRFGNVLGSNGSVIPLFKKQIAKGGPVTVTDQNITRFFMTIPEAVSLILQAVTYAKGGEIFVLDMGEPVKIYDLAKTLIKLTGYVPEVDIPIKITGLRPGEKLYEELLMAEEGLTSTKHDKIYISKPSDISITEVEKYLSELEKIKYDKNYSIDKVKEAMKKVVPTYHEVDGGNK